jgi:prevent-host-death family protein
MTKQISISDAKKQLPALLDKVKRGESFVIAKAGRPVALLSPVQKPKRKKIRFGFMKGKVKLAPDFDDPLPDWPLDAFEGRGSHDPV